MSLVEVLVALGMVGVLAFTLASVMETSARSQRQSNVVNTLENMRNNISKLINDSTAWTATVNDPANAVVMNCIKTGTLCNDSAAGAIPSDLTTSNAILAAPPFLQLTKLMPASGTAFIDNSAAGNGFTFEGAPCTTFNGGVGLGNDQCPIKWQVNLSFECNPTPCFNPILRVIAYVYYNPTQATANKLVVSEFKYRLDTHRGPQGDPRNDVFRASYKVNGDGGACGDINFSTVDQNDNGNNLTNGTSLTFKPGTYTCSVSSTCFACGYAQLTFFVGGVAVATSNMIASKRWEMTSVSLQQVVFTVNGPVAVRVNETCAQPPGGPGPGALGTGVQMGFFLAPYTSPTTYSYINCTRLF